MSRTHTMHTLQTEIQRLNEYQEALEILDLVWIELGPYNTVLTPNTKQRLNTFMEFDDSE